MVITFTLQAAYSGSTYVAGPFNISGTTNTGTVTQLATGITKTQLLTGHTITAISDATTGGTINSTGTCTNSIPWLANSAPTPTPTTTTVGPTLTPLPLYGFFRSNPASVSSGHCNGNQITSAQFYSTSNTIPGMLNTTVYTNTSYTAFTGFNAFYAVSSVNTFNTNNQPYYVIEVSDTGEVTNVVYISSCSGENIT